MDAKILHSIIKSWLECEMLYEKLLRNNADANNDKKQYYDGYIQALTNIYNVINGTSD